MTDKQNQKITTSNKKVKKARLTVLFITLVFAGPFALSQWMYTQHKDQSFATTNYGELITPSINVHELRLKTLAGEDISNEHMQGHWWLILATPKECDKTCQDELYYLKQTHIALGKEASRVKKLVIAKPHSDVTKFIQTKDFYEVATLVQDAELDERLAHTKNIVPRDFDTPIESSAHLLIKDLEKPLILVDPLGNIVMRYPDNFEAAKLLKDIKHLLKHSQIG